MTRARKIAVLAYTRGQCDQWLRENGVDPHDAVYINDLTDLFDEFSELHLIGTWYQKPGAWPLMRAARARVRK